MIFESLWPLAFVLAVPIIIVLYLLVPKGKEYKISSNLLWKKLYQNQQSKTFLEKFIHNLLMYLQINAIQLSIISVVFCHREPLFFMPKNFKNITKNS